MLHSDAKTPQRAVGGGFKGHWLAWMVVLVLAVLSFGVRTVHASTQNDDAEAESSVTALMAPQ